MISETPLSPLLQCYPGCGGVFTGINNLIKANKNMAVLGLQTAVLLPARGSGRSNTNSKGFIIATGETVIKFMRE